MKIEVQENKLSWANPYELEVTLQRSGSVNLSNVKATKVHLENRGAGHINFHGQTQSITNSLYGPGDIKLKGKTQSIEIYTRGPGDIEAFGMETNMVCKETFTSPELKVMILGGSANFSNVKATKVHLENRGAGKINFHGQTHSPELEVTLQRSGSVNLSNVKATKVHLENRGAGKINFHGQTHSPELEVTLQRSGSVNLSNVKATKVHLENRGAGHINFHGQTQSITNSLYGPGDIKLKGKTQSIEIYTRGPGDIEAFGMETISCKGIIITEEIKNIIGIGPGNIYCKETFIALNLK